MRTTISAKSDKRRTGVTVTPPQSVMASVIATVMAATLAACGGEGAVKATPVDAEDAASAGAAIEEAAAEKQDPGAILDAVIAGDHRRDEEKARDVWRHPKETLTFFGVQPDHHVVEITPGGGWYTNVIAPYVNAGDGVYYAAGSDPARSDRAARAVAAFKEAYTEKSELYGDVRMTVLGQEIAPAGSADAVVTFRNVHNWMRGDGASLAFASFYDALKPGGVLGVVEHRADEDADNGGGYVKVSTVKEFAAAAGFVFEASSEVNANEADTKDHPFGVWTLPPVRRSSRAAGIPEPGFDREKYDAIGESDRMTLRFRKPLTEESSTE